MQRTIYILSLVVLFYFKPVFKSSVDAFLLGILSFFFIVCFFFHVFYNGRLIKNYFRIDIIFLVGFMVVHLQWAVMFSLSGISPDMFSRVWSDELYVNYGTWLATVGGVSWMFGYSLLPSARRSNSFLFNYSYKNLLYVTFSFFFLFLIFSGSSFLSGAVYKGEGGTSAGEGISAYIQLFFSISVIVLTAIVVLRHAYLYNGSLLNWVLKIDKRYLILISLYLGLFLLIGDRGGPIALILSLLVLTGTFVRAIKLKELLLIFVIGSLILTMIGLGRSETSGLGIFTSGAEKLDLDSGYDMTLNLANSVRTLYTALSYVPENHDFFYGQLWIGNFLSPIPFAQSIFLSIFKLNSYEISSSGYITYIVYGTRPTSGEGSSLIADIYLNFGIYGVLFFMFLLGVFFKKVNNELILSRDINWIVVAAIVASFSLTLSRAGLLIMIRPIIWGGIIFFLFTNRNKTIK